MVARHTLLSISCTYCSIHTRSVEWVWPPPISFAGECLPHRREKGKAYGDKYACFIKYASVSSYGGLA